MKLQSFQLPNKLKVLLLENHKAPVITIQSWVRTGSADEQKNQEGLSHFIEHLLFKGTKKFKVGEIAQIIEGAGGDLNAYTSFDQTVFYMTLSSEYADLGLDCMSEMMGEPLFDPKEVDSEREVVIEEIKRTQDNPARRSSYLLFSSLYPNHSYGRPVIGYTKIVQETPVENIKKLYFERYCPENMFLLVVGDFQSDEIKKKIKKYFSSLKGKLRKVKRPQEKIEKKPKVLVEKAPFQESYLNLAWPTFDANEQEQMALELLSYVLAYGDNTRLVRSLRLQKPLVNDIGAFQFVAKDPGFFSISAYFEIKNLEEILEELAGEILLLNTNCITEGEMTKAINQIESSEYYHETMDAFARKIGSDEFLYNDPNYFEKYLQKIKKIKPEHISDAVKKFLNPENLKISLLYSEKESTPRGVLEKWQEDFQVAFSDLVDIRAQKEVGNNTQLLKRPRPIEAQKQKEIFETESGTKIILYPLPGTGVVSARAGFLGGLRADLKNKEGGFELLSKTWLTGSENKSESEIAEILESKSSAIQAFSGRNSFGLQMQTLNSEEKDIANLFREILLNPQFPEKEFLREKEILVRQIENLVDHPSSLVFSEFMKCLFEGHPYAHETHGTRDSISSLHTEDLKKLYGKYAVAKNMTLVVAGGVDIPFWKDFIHSVTEKMKTGERFEKTFVHDSVGKTQKVFRALNKEQSHIIYGYRGLSLFDQDKYALQVMQTMLSGQGGRLFINLRDKASLAYSVSPVRMDGIETGYFGGYIGCSPEKGERAIQMMREEFEKLIETKAPAEEVLRAQKNIIGKQDIGLQKTSSLTANILFEEIYGNTYLEPKEFHKKIMSVTAEQIRDVAKRIFSQHPVIACVGPICPWE